jgi:hypothetical protein
MTAVDQGTAENTDLRLTAYVRKYAVTPGILPYRNASTAMGMPCMTYESH